MSGPESVEQTNLVIRVRGGAQGKAYWDAQWRFRLDRNGPWQLKKQRLGLAWQEPDGTNGWRKRRGRCPEGWLDERAADRAAEEAMRQDVKRLAEEQEEARRKSEQLLTVRAAASE